MQDIIEKLKKIEEEYGYQAFLEHYNPSSGYYIKVEKDNTFNVYHSTGLKDDTFPLIEEYDFFKGRMFLEGMINSHKCVDAKYKKIHSVTPYALILKYETLTISEFKDDKTFDDILLNHLNLVNSLNDNTLNVDELFEIYSNVIAQIKEQMQEVLKKDDKILIFLDRDLEDYQTSYFNYLNGKLLGNCVMIDDVLYGVPTFSLSLNAKKPTLSKNPYQNVPYRTVFEDAVLLHYLSKIKMNKVSEILNFDTDDVFKADVRIDLNSTTKSKEITYYNMNKDVREYERPILKNKLLELDFNQDDLIEGVSTRNELLRDLDFIFNLDKNSYLFSELLNIHNGDYKNFMIKAKTNDIAQIFISNKDVLEYYFKDNGDINISRDLSKIMFTLYLELFKNEVLTKRLRNCLDFMLTALIYTDKKGEYSQMPKEIKKMWEKLVIGKKTGEYEIETEEEFFFASGQLLAWLCTLSETANSSYLVMQDVLTLKTSDAIKDKVIEHFNQYSHAIPLHSNNFINTLFRAVMSFEINKNFKAKDFKGKYYYHAGLVGKNIKFETTKEKELIENE